MAVSVFEIFSFRAGFSGVIGIETGSGLARITETRYLEIGSYFSVSLAACSAGNRAV